MVCSLSLPMSIEDRDRRSGARKRTATLVGILLASLLVAAGCGDDDSGGDGGGESAGNTPLTADAGLLNSPSVGGSSTAEVDGDRVTVDVGAGKSVTLDGGRMKIAFFLQGAGLTYFDVQAEAARAAAKKYGLGEIQFFDGGFDAAKQRNQIQSAISSGRFDAMVISPTDASSCELATIEAPENDILVTVPSNPLCGKDSEPNSELWAPGTLSFVGGVAALDAFTAFAEHAVEENPGAEMLVVTGPPGHVGAESFVAAVEKATSGSDVEVAAISRGMYTAESALNETTNLMRANPDASVVVTNYPDLTDGVVQAVQQAGRGDEVKVYDVGGSKLSLDLLKAGQIEVTMPFYPYSAGYGAVEALALAAKGESVPRIVLNDGNPLGPTAVQEDPPLVLVTPDDADGFKPQY